MTIQAKNNQVSRSGVHPPRDVVNLDIELLISANTARVVSFIEKLGDNLVGYWRTGRLHVSSRAFVGKQDSNAHNFCT